MNTVVAPVTLLNTSKLPRRLAVTNGNVTAAAKKHGISRRTLHRKINEMNAERAPVETADTSRSKE